MPRPRNYFNVGVRFDRHAYSVTSRTDVELTPPDVLKELQDFCQRIKRDLAHGWVASGRARPDARTPGRARRAGNPKTRKASR